ncbi:NAD(P)H-dependent oxidoreductase [Dyadobacter sp. CY312]|uniref:NAD(P)H-dependent oxidoreductase n=1 Tax=Dyadobacter sp. CY312 TaxID=2907303 RepID=UPI001F1D3BA0|nr:NAD(P)H-dependent oxidoreductase [Dyadobacter sp. CY312]MCE7040708.1 NAD(P)H-dependent oxidoreductase [Dyadobacter sp. CY312]
MSDLIEKLNWRYAAKRMTGESIPEEKLNTILEAIKLSPSSVGLQPYNILVISDKTLKERIFNEAAQQPQIKESSHLLVFAVWEKITAEHITQYMNLIAKTRGIEVASLEQFQQKISDSILDRTEQTNFDWAARQAYIALGHASVAAASEHIDSTPMEGFNNAKLDDILELNKKGLKSVVMMTLGYRDSTSDHLASAKKVRRSNEDLFTAI